MNTDIHKDKQHANSAVTATETAHSSSGKEGGDKRGGRRGGIGVPPNNRVPKTDRLPPKIFWEKIRREFSPLWAFYPEAGRRDYESCFKYYNKIKKSMPPMAYLCGVVDYLSKNVWVGYTPSLMKFMENKDWLGISDKVKADIESNMPYWERKMQEKINEFNGVSYRVQPNNIQPKPQEKPQEEQRSISDEVPPAEEIERMSIEQQIELALKNGYGIPISIFIDAVRRRDQSRNKKQEGI